MFTLYVSVGVHSHLVCLREHLLNGLGFGLRLRIQGLGFRVYGLDMGQRGRRLPPGLLA